LLIRFLIEFHRFIILNNKSVETLYARIPQRFAGWNPLHGEEESGCVKFKQIKRLLEVIFNL